MKWTPEADAHFLLKIIEVCDIKPDYKAVANAWGLGEERPTPKALTEHMGKLRKLAKTGNGGSGNGPPTPKKKDSIAKVTPKPSNGQKRKRKAESGLIRPNNSSDVGVVTKSDIAGTEDYLNASESSDGVPVKVEPPKSKKVKLTFVNEEDDESDDEGVTLTSNNESLAPFQLKSELEGDSVYSTT